MLGSHPGWGGWGLHILPATLWAGARPGDESYGSAAAFGFAIPLELGDNPGVSPATSPVAAGTGGGRGEDAAAGKEGAAGASWFTRHVAADGTGTKRFMAHGSVSFSGEALTRELLWPAMGRTRSSVSHSPWVAPEGTPVPEGSGRGIFPSDSRSGVALQHANSPPPSLHLAGLQRVAEAKEQRC